MNKVVRFVVLPLGGIVVIVVAIMVYIAATFDPNQYKLQIVQAVRDQTGRTLRLDGDIRLSLYPDIGAALGKASLSERAGDTDFAAADDFQLALKLLPLLNKEVIIDAITTTNLRANLIRYRDGSTNFDDLAGLLASGHGTSQVKVEVGRFSVRNATITYTDQIKGEKYVLSKLDFTTGRVADGVPVRIELAFEAQSDRPGTNLFTTLNTTARFDFDGKNHAFHGLELRARGMLAGIGDIEAIVTGGVDARPASREFLISNLSATVTGRQGGRDFELRMAAPRLTVTGDEVNGEKLALDATLIQTNRKLTARFEIPALLGNAQAFRADAVMASIDARMDDAAFKIRLKSEIAGSVDTGKIDFAKLTAAVNVSHPKLLKKPLDATLNGSASADFVRQTARFAVAGKFDDSKISATAGLLKFSPPSYVFEIGIDRLDADRYARGDEPGRKQPQNLPELNAFRNLDANGSLVIGSLTMSGIKASNVRVEFKADRRRPNAVPAAANRDRNPIDCAPPVAIGRYTTCIASRPG